MAVDPAVKEGFEDKDVYEAVVEWHWQRKPQLLGAKSPPFPVYLSQIPHRMAAAWKWAAGWRIEG